MSLRRVVVGLLLGAGVVIATFALHEWVNAQQETAKVKETKTNAAIAKTLEEIRATQLLILEKLQAIQDELQVVKVRCTR